MEHKTPSDECFTLSADEIRLLQIEKYMPLTRTLSYRNGARFVLRHAEIAHDAIEAQEDMNGVTEQSAYDKSVVEAIIFDLFPIVVEANAHEDDLNARVEIRDDHDVVPLYHEDELSRKKTRASTWLRRLMRKYFNR